MSSKLRPIVNDSKVYGIVLIVSGNLIQANNPESALTSFNLMNLILIIIIFFMFVLSFFFSKSVVNPIKILV